MNQGYDESRQDSVDMTTIVHGDFASDSNKLLPSFSNDLSFDPKLSPSPAPNIVQSEDPSSPNDLSSYSKLLPSPAPNIDKSDVHSSSGDVLSSSTLLLPPSPAPNIDKSDVHSHSSSICDVLSASKLLLPPSPAPNIDKSDVHSISGDVLPASKLLLPPSPAPNIVQSDDPSSSYDLPSEFKFLPSPASDIPKSDVFRSSTVSSASKLLPSPAPNISISTSPKSLALTDGSGTLFQIFKLLPSPAPNIIGSIHITNPVDTRSIFPYWEYWENKPPFSHSFDLRSYNTGNWFQGILVFILNHLKCLVFLDGPVHCTHHLHRFLSMILFTSSFFFNVFTTFRRLGDISIMHDA
jgi:hypothetical protein